MKTRLIKEFKVLRLPFAATLLLTAIPFAIWEGAYKEFSAFLFAFGCAVMACLSFGSEFQHRTVDLLLSQPVSRSVIWREKMLTLATLLGLNLGLLLIYLIFVFPEKYSIGFNFAVITLMAFIPFCAFCTGPYICLIIRNLTAAIILTLSFPVFIMALTSFFSEWLYKNGMPEDVAVIISTGPPLLIYCLLFLWLGFYKWKKLDAWDATFSKEIALPDIENLIPYKRISAAWTGPFASLFKKEMQLQKVNFLVAGIFLCISIIGACLLPFRTELAQGTIALGFALNIFLVPLIAGTVPFTEERNWGMAEWHLTLPIPAWKQWAAKLLASFSSTLALSLLLPVILFLAGIKIFDPHASSSHWKGETLNLGTIILYLLLVMVPLYLASFSTNTARAIIFSVVGIGALFISLFALQYIFDKNEILRILMAFIVIPGWILKNAHLSPFAYPALEGLLLICLVLRFTYTNFKQPKRPTRFIVYQSLIIYACFALIFLTCTSMEDFSDFR